RNRRYCFCTTLFMDSINQQQPEKNHQDLHGEEARKKIKELTEKATTCFFCTNVPTGGPFATRPMSLQQLDAEGNLWFLSAKDSYKNQQIAVDPSVQLLFQGSDYSDFLQLQGKATITDDKNKIQELWSPILKTWFTAGIDDPRISAIKVEPEQGYYWDTKHNQAIALAKRLVGAAIGKTLDDSIEGEVRI
ncbi:MAG TPA: pyridoxamine 5'-phosphate oxidase family protein, partial [Flavisolibacter sp.]|nr:pyridoxamine 5'-phosphate oxidase family protein [Flavisolibacter sp.]